MNLLRSRHHERQQVAADEQVGPDLRADHPDHGVGRPADSGFGDRPGDGGELPPPPVADRTSVLKVPTFSVLATILGVLAAWGAIAVASALLFRLDVPLGFNLGIADGGPGDDGFWAGFWQLVVTAGAFLAGGYAAARLARNHGTPHALIMWLVAMGATLGDAIFEWSRSGEEGVLRLVPGMPFWGETGMTGDGGRRAGPGAVRRRGSPRQLRRRRHRPSREPCRADG